MNEAAFHPEDIARSLIDRRLVACGWLIQSNTEINLGAGLGVAVREFQTASGPVDYGLCRNMSLRFRLEEQMRLATEVAFAGGRPRALRKNVVSQRLAFCAWGCFRGFCLSPAVAPARERTESLSSPR